jgi:NTP pyrophosphatase (non-canonical NTP hydrolase)
MMNTKTYLEMSARTASSQFHDDIVDAAMLEHTLIQAIGVGQNVDVVKKSLFYGKPIKAGAEIESVKGSTSTIDAQATHQDVLHAALGIFTEASELLEAVLSAMKGSRFDEVNIFEELGDVEWYMAMMYRYLDKTPEEARDVNIEKLAKRFPNKFASDDAINRDIGAERSILEKGHRGRD